MNTNPVTLQIAVIDQIEEFANAGQIFSAHNVTQKLREKCNANTLVIPEIESQSGSDKFKYEVPHTSVRNIVRHVISSGMLGSKFTFATSFNGMYNEYTATKVAAPATAPKRSLLGVFNNPVQSFNDLVQSVTQSTPSSPSATSPTGSGNSEIQRRIKLYIDNSNVRGFKPSLKQVQSAIKRRGKLGITCNEIQDIIVNELKYSPSSVWKH